MDYADMGSYTQLKYEDMINEASEGYDVDCDFSMLLDKLNSEDFFEPFSERLRRYISKHLGKDCTAQEAYLFLYDKIKNAGAAPSRNKIKNWLNVSGSPEGNDGPNMGDAGREAMFQVAFALGLNVQETEDFFHRVYLDKAFNARNVKEFVYFYCILHGKTYAEAQDLAAEAERILSSGTDTSATADTVLINNKAQSAGDDDELLAFVAEHPFSFTRKNETALRELENILTDLRGSDNKKGLAEEEFDTFKPYDVKGTEGRSVHSVDFVLDMAVNGAEQIEKTPGNAGIKRAREVFVRKEISNQFPNANTISHPDSSYILRKDIILLFFYRFWVQDSLKGYPKGDDETFRDEMRNTLHRCGFSPLYYGNPYDWLFLYCSNCKINGSWPLDVFRGILANEDTVKLDF